MKIVLVISIIGVAVFIGYQIYKRFCKREAFYKDLLNFSEISFSEINFLHTKIIEIIDKNLHLFNKEFKIFLEEYKKYLISNLDKSKFREQVLEKISVLQEKEIDLICNFFCVLGNKDVDSELNNINNYKVHFKERVDQTKTEKNKYGGLYFKLSIMIAIMLVIIII